ncbi:MAG: hypothetical protein FVQ79_05235 [Planctomycetes bacterium]|nr:hypothetical protein [Planctomycetota bacterium]
MKSSHVLLLAVVVVVAGLLIGAAGYPARWEYARLHYGPYAKWNWMAPDVFVEGESVDELCQNLGIISAADVGSMFTIADWAGESGWEMAMTTKVPQEYIVMWFKRPK